MVFYRKYRPQKFSDVVGQKHILETIANALATHSFSHGYLFAGPRGSGKTTLARILAKALNCTGRKLGKDSYEPCNKCISCKEITLGKSLDLIEIDAASNRGIDEIRELREKIRFAPTSSEYKVYIIDEVHMLTKEAFNALLKTLEEPPKHAVFIMATTEPQKILPTILSRVQRFDFHRAETAELIKLIKKVANLENIKIDDEAMELIAQLSQGSYRDSLSLFGQISSLRKTAASNITLSQIQQVLGLAHDKSVFEFIKFLASSDRKKAFEIISKLHAQGTDLENFTVKLIEILRKIALFKLGEDQLFDLTKEQQEELKILAESFDIDILMQIISKFAAALSQIKSAPLPQLPLEMLIYEFTQNGKQLTANSLQPKIEEKIEKKAVSRKPLAVGNLSKDLWASIIKEARTHNHSLSALLRDAVLAGANDETIILAFKFKFHADMVSGKRTTQTIENIIAKITGLNYKVVCTVDPNLVIKKPTDSDEELLSGAKEVFEVEE